MAAAKKSRRTREEVLKLVAEVDALRTGPEKLDAQTACDKVGLSQSVYWKNKKPQGQRSPVQRGTARVSDFPPRPKKGGKRQPKPVDRTDLSSVAMRIAKLDNKLRGIQDLVNERIELVGVLVKLLKGKKSGPLINLG